MTEQNYNSEERMNVFLDLASRQMQAIRQSSMNQHNTLSQKEMAVMALEDAAVLLNEFFKVQQEIKEEFGEIN